MKKDILQTVGEYCEKLLEKGRCKSLQFHNYRHTMDVVENANNLARLSGVEGTDLEILLIAAHFHDVGNIKNSKHHEMLSCTIASIFLKRHSYPLDQIKVIEHIIMATQLNVEPKNLLEKIICDADLGHLGKPSFILQNQLLRNEWFDFLGIEFSDEDWREMNLKFLNNHHFYTDAALKLYSKQKKINIEDFENSAFAKA
jgi:predicted metal-dependent HD superfamily phosphohydrolase